MNSSKPPRSGLVRRVLRVVAGNWISGGYLALCFALLVWVWIDSTFVDHADASFAGVVPMLATAPVSLVLLLLVDTVPGGFYLPVVLGAVVNAAVIGWCVEALRGRARTPARTTR